MKDKLLEFICCPKCFSRFSLNVISRKDGEIYEGFLRCESCSDQYPIVKFIPRFVGPQNYAGGFGFQWKKFRQVQLDSFSGHPISKNRFFSFSGWNPDEIRGKLVLDVGCGAGRFSEIALDYGACVVAVDYSNAIEACYENHFKKPNFFALQGDVNNLPFEPGKFNFVFCLGVLQHTPNVKKAFMALPKQLSSGGKLAVDLYPKLWLNLLWPKYWLRLLTKGGNPRKLFNLVKQMVSSLLPISLILGRLPYIGRKLRYIIPVANYENIFPLTDFQLREWALLDTFDMLSPLYDNPQSIESVLNWFKEAKMEKIEVFRQGFIVGRGEKSF